MGRNRLRWVLLGEHVHRAQEGGWEGSRRGQPLKGSRREQLSFCNVRSSLVAALQVEFPEAYLLGAKSLESDSQLGYKSQLYPNPGLSLNIPTNNVGSWRATVGNVPGVGPPTASP